MTQQLNRYHNNNHSYHVTRSITAALFRNQSASRGMRAIFAIARSASSTLSRHIYRAATSNSIYNNHLRCWHFFFSRIMNSISHHQPFNAALSWRGVKQYQ